MCLSTLLLRAGEPTPWSFHQRKMKLAFRRAPYTHGCPIAGCDTSTLRAELDLVTVERWVPVLGNMIVSGDVPKTFTVPTKNRIVFAVLHDPPVRGLAPCTVSLAVLSSRMLLLFDCCC